MSRFSRITKISILLAIFFALDKGLGIIRQVIIGRQFGFSTELDVFNAANNLPDFLFALISGGAIAIAIIPILSEIIIKDSQKKSWEVFSTILNLAFIATALLSIIIAIFAKPIVTNQLGIAPGFSESQQEKVVNLMRLNLVATLIFSISGLVMAGLQANQHFLFPALAPILYDVGQIFGALILAPEDPYVLLGIKLPAFGMGINGLVYGVIIGAFLHLLIQIPVLFRFGFFWKPYINLRDHRVENLFVQIWPRIVSMLFIQLIFIAQDNLASRMQTGAVTSLTYGWLIMQVPETLIGTSIATALLPALSELVAQENWKLFKEKLMTAYRVVFAITLPIFCVGVISIAPILQFIFGDQDVNMLTWTTSAFLLGLTGHSLVELGTRAFYSRKNPIIPLISTVASFFLFLVLSILFFNALDVSGIALSNSITYSAQALVLFLFLKKHLPNEINFEKVIPRTIIGSIVGGLIAWLIIRFLHFPNMFLPIEAVIAAILGIFFAYLYISKEIKLLFTL